MATATAKAKGKSTAKTIVDTSSTGHIRLMGNGKKILDIGASQADMLVFVRQFPELKPGPFELVITGTIDKKSPAKKPAAKKPAPKS
jgi:hypothetical protein